MARYQGFDYDNFDRIFGPPLAVEDGIRVQSFGERWWSRRWISLLEGFGLGSRLQRGRSYARKGQVIEITVEPGHVRARVQGSRHEPYRAEIQLASLDDTTWAKLLEQLAGDVACVGKLLAGELPPEIEHVFRSAGVSLLPSNSSELHSSCTCPDYVVPCKHIAAVHYVLAEAFGSDPFLLLLVRGMPRERMLDQLVGADARRPASESSAPKPEPRQNRAIPLPVDHAEFWSLGQGSKRAEPEPERDEAGELGKRLVERLGSLPFWRSEQGLAEWIGRAQQQAEERALDWLASSLDGSKGEPQQ